MSAAKHTPGPWYLRTNRHPETDGRPWGWLDTMPPGSGRQSSPAGVQVTWTKGETSEANARLIAAAPDLLQALQEIAKQCPPYTGDFAPGESMSLSDFGGNGDDLAYESAQRSTGAIGDIARAAIAKATGSTS